MLLNASIFQDASTIAKNVMIYFDNSVDSFKNPIQPCTTVDECLDICDLHPEACAAPIDVTRIQTDGVWSREKQNNPFADYYKVRLDICIPKSLLLVQPKNLWTIKNNFLALDNTKR